jgi:putative transcriptional regulator
MEFEWDLEKSEACFAERGFDLAYVLRAFMDPDRLIQKDTRWDYGEDRYQLLWSIDWRMFFWRIPFVEQLSGLFRRAKPTNERYMSMKKVHVKIDPVLLAALPKGRVNKHRLDATSERDIALQLVADDAEAMQDAAKFARRVRKRLGLSQLEFSHRIDVSLETIRNWEQGKRRPTGAAKALLKVLDKAPEAALSALG